MRCVKNYSVEISWKADISKMKLEIRGYEEAS
jgi:hypothetical protein